MLLFRREFSAIQMVLHNIFSKSLTTYGVFLRKVLPTSENEMHKLRSTTLSPSSWAGFTCLLLAVLQHLLLTGNELDPRRQPLKGVARLFESVQRRQEAQHQHQDGHHGEGDQGTHVACPTKPTSSLGKESWPIREKFWKRVHSLLLGRTLPWLLPLRKSAGKICC